MGTQTIKTAQTGRFTQLEGRSHFQGSLGNLTVVQRSKCRPRGVSAAFLEETQERGGIRRFEVTFDSRSGLVTAAKGPKDRAETPYVLPYRDPLSLLHEVRQLGELEAPHRVPLLGKEVTVQYGGEVELETVLGVKRAFAYVLHPGQSVIYVDAEGPHQILKLTQRLVDGQLDALLVKVGTEASMEPFAEPGAKRQAKSKSGRRRGRRRPRRRKRPDG